MLAVGPAHCRACWQSAGCSVHGVDASPAMIRCAREAARTASNGESMSFECGDILALSGEVNGPFDGVLCSSVIEYLDRPEDAITLFERVLKPGGFLIVSFPSKYSLVRRLLVILFQLSRLVRRKPWPGFLEFSKNEFSCREFTRLVGRHGFEVIRTGNVARALPFGIQRYGLFTLLMMVLARKIG